ncbi:MAG: efflux RND transporter periplasmic adaptor subunit [Chloroflexi bacterium]|nr:efflux RND transporter periplasmic adaptor subunit [Chloroflexota bacterium]
MPKLFANRIFIIALAAVLLTAGGGYYYYSQIYLPAQAPVEPALQTAKVRTGDIVITASGAGNLVPTAELDLGFRSSGVLVELNVAVGDHVEAGTVLARLDDSAARIQVEQAELNLEQARDSEAELTSESAIAKAELDVANAETALEEAQAYLVAVKNPDVAAYQAAYDAAVAELAQAKNASTITDLGSLTGAVYKAQDAVDRAADVLNQVKVAIESCAGCDAATAAVTIDKKTYTFQQAQDDYNGAVNSLAVAQLNLEAAQYKNEQSTTAAQEAVDDAWWSLQWALNPGPDDATLAGAQARAAEANLTAAREKLADLLAGNPPGSSSVRQAELSLESARLTFANSTLTAPVSGTVTAVKADVGEAVGTTPIITLSALDQPLVRFYVEETDLGKVAVGYPINVVFDAAPDVTFTGKIARVDPALVTVDGSPAVQAWAQLDPGASTIRLISGMTAEVEIIAGESKNALLAPVQALRELAPGSYAVFVVLPDGQLKLTPVTVGLKDFANAEILSGLKAGDIVSTGTVETK